MSTRGEIDGVEKLDGDSMLINGIRVLSSLLVT